jgi:diguanylate cyclase (GGDEF)-like protein
MKSLSLKIRILIPLTLAITLLLGTFAVIFYRYQQEHTIGDVNSKIKSLQELYIVQLDSEAAMMAAALELMLRDEKLKIALKAKDREALLEQTLIPYSELHATHQITHFYVTGPDRVNILRVHEPERYGDEIDRITTLEAERTKKLFYGIELGPLGTFTLRVVTPWYDGGQLLGYLELGKEILHIVDKLHEILSVEIFVLIDKKFLNEKDWEAGMKMLGRNFEWNQFPSVVTVYKTIDLFPIKLPPMFSEKYQKSTGESKEIISNGMHYRYLVLPLKDAGGRSIGNMVIMRDITTLIGNLHTTLIIVGVICLMVGGILFGLFYLHIGRVESLLEHANKEIQTLAISDQLTGLYNRRGFITLAEQQLKVADRTWKGVLLFFADLDGMKWINDTLGHEEGDKALVEIATVLKETFRLSDIIARIGGDEFAVLVIDTTEGTPEILMNRLQDQIDRHNNQVTRKYPLSISIGSCYYDPENPLSLDELTACADTLMYEQKKSKKPYPI